MAAGMMKPSAGRVWYDNQPVVRSMDRVVGYITQRDNLLPWRNVEGNVGLALELNRVGSQERREKVEQFVSLIGLTGFEKHYPAELSGGMRKRVALARTLIYDPETMLMDEPFGALDAMLKLSLQQELLRLWDSSRKTILFVTHDLTEAVSLADRVVVMSSRGKIKTVQDIDLPRPRDVYRIRFSP